VTRRDSLLTPIAKPSTNINNNNNVHSTSSDGSAEAHQNPKHHHNLPPIQTPMKKTNSVNSPMIRGLAIPLPHLSGRSGLNSSIDNNSSISSSSNSNYNNNDNDNDNKLLSPRIEQLDYFQQFLATNNSPTTAMSTISDVGSDRGVSEIEENFDDSGQDYFNQFFTNSNTSITPSTSSSSLSNIGDGPKQYRIAKWAKTMDEEGELAFEVGDVITVISSHSSGWWVGTIDNQICGIFPVNYTLPLPFGEEEE
jgi:hypothetical protein